MNEGDFKDYRWYLVFVTLEHIFFFWEENWIFERFKLDPWLKMGNFVYLERQNWGSYSPHAYHTLHMHMYYESLLTWAHTNILNIVLIWPLEHNISIPVCMVVPISGTVIYIYTNI